MGRTEYVVPIFLCLMYGASGLPRVDPLVDSNVGLIRGLAAPDGEYSMFMGIPYATVDPLNPFGPSIPHPGFESTFDAVNDIPLCPQWDEASGSFIGTLDCLRLNVYVPNMASSRNPVPVIVYVHGGGFIMGSSGRITMGPKFLVSHDVIVVTLHYRLAAYGFLCPDIPEVPGNQGLKDQLTALRWIKNNIGAFGGDKNKITIMGESAGGMSVDLHLIYSQENLFNNIIVQSGTALSNFVIKDADPNAPIALAAYLGFNTDDIYEALQYLRSVNETLIVAATEGTNIWFTPCVETEFDNVERYITSHPVNMNVVKTRTVPILMGFNSNEQGQMYNNDIIQWDPLSSVADIFDFDSEYHEEMLAYIRHFYLGDEAIDSEKVRQDIINFRSDFGFGYPTYRSMKKYLENRSARIFHYIFSYDGDRNLIKSRDNFTNVNGAFHGDELSYLFDVFEDTPTPEDQLMIDRITTLWTNFAKFSDPTPEVTEILPVQWPTITNENLYYLNIDSELSVQRRPFHDRMAYWDLFFKLNQEFLKGLEN